MLYDRAQISGTARITKDGYFVADALVARANNIQEYRASELGLTDRDPGDIVRVFRPADEVFHKDALSTLAHRPITLDHPADAVKAENWKALAVGDVGDDILRDGEFVRVPIKIMDAAAIESVRTNRREFSLGYTAKMVADAGEYEGQPYDFVAKDFRYNHLAAVPVARGGAELRIIDERTINPEKPMKITIGDAKDVDLSDGAAVALAVGALNTSLADTQAKLTAATDQAVADAATITAKDAEIADLKAKLADAAITPAKLAEAAKEYADAQAKAKALGVTVAADADTAAIKKAVVDAKMGDAAKDYTADHVAIAFDALTKDAKADETVRDAFKGGVKPIGDAANDISKARASWLADKATAYRAKA